MGAESTFFPILPSHTHARRLSVHNTNHTPTRPKPYLPPHRPLAPHNRVRRLLLVTTHSLSTPTPTTTSIALPTATTTAAVVIAATAAVRAAAAAAVRAAPAAPSAVRPRPRIPPPLLAAALLLRFGMCVFVC